MINEIGEGIEVAIPADCSTIQLPKSAAEPIRSDTRRHQAGPQPSARPVRHIGDSAPVLVDHFRRLLAAENKVMRLA
jgi:hypothetical protein